MISTYINKVEGVEVAYSFLKTKDNVNSSIKKRANLLVNSFKISIFAINNQSI